MRYAESTKEAVRSLAAAGARPAEIRRELGLDASLSTIMRWCGHRWEPTEEQRLARNAYGKAWRERNARAHNAKRIARQELDRALVDVERPLRDAVDSAIRSLHRAEDAIVRASKLS